VVIRTAGKLLLAADASRLGIPSDSRTTEILFEMALGSLVFLIAWWRANPSVPFAEVEEPVFRLFAQGLAGIADTDRTGA
jgi:hypothetical protein